MTFAALSNSFNPGLTEFLRILVYAGAICVLLFAVTESLRRGRLSIPITVLSLMICSILLRLQLFLDGWLQHNFMGAFLLVSSILLIGPVIYRQALDMVDFALERTIDHRIHLILPAGTFITEIVMFFVFDNWVGKSIANLYIGEVNYIRVVVALSVLNVLLYFILLIFKNLEIRQKYDIKYTRMVWLILLLPSLSVAGAAAGFFFNSFVMLQLAGVLITVCVFLLFIFTARYPVFFSTLREDLKEKRYASVHLGGINVDEVKQRLNELMNEKQIYRDDQLRLPQLADELLITTHQLSRILNESYGQNFNSYINKFRVEEAKKILLAEPDKSILSIAYEVGFYSKTTFNTTFARVAECTPAEYRKRNEKPKKS